MSLFNPTLGPPTSPLDLRQELGLEDAPGLQRLRDLASEQEASLGQVDENLPYDLAQVHPTAHLLVPAGATDRQADIRGRSVTVSSPRPPGRPRPLPLLALVERVLVHCLVVLGADVVQAAVVPERPPLHVDTHAALLAIHDLDVPHLLHVAGVASSS